MNICFLDTESYLLSLQEAQEDPEYAQQLNDISGYNVFVATLDQFMDRKGSETRLTTELYLIQEEMEKALKTLNQENDDADMRALEEHYLQQRYALMTGRTHIYDSVHAIYANAASTIRESGRQIADMLTEGRAE